MKGIQFHEDFHADRCPSDSTGKQMAATIAAGEQDYDVYKAVAKHNAIVVGGSNPVR